MTLAQHKARLKELAGELNALSTKENVAAEDQAAHIVAVDKLVADIEAKEAEIASMEKAEATRARLAKLANDPIIEPTQERIAAQVDKPLKTSEKIGLMIVGLALAYREDGSKNPRAVFNKMDEAGYGFVAKEFADHYNRVRALNSGSAVAGGVLVPENMANEIIDVLRPMTTFLQGGPRTVPMIGGTYKVPAAASSASANWRGEGQAISKSQPTFKEINMSTHFVDAMVPLTNQLLRWSLPDVRGWVEMDMANVMGVEIDRAAYMGEGTANIPLGITKIAGVTRNAASGATAPTVAQIEDDASTAELSMMQANLPMLGAKWVMNPRTLIFLQNLRDGNGNRYFPELQGESRTWRNKPVLVTTQVPVNGGGTTDESEIWLIAFGHVMMGQGIGMNFGVSDTATVVTNGVSVSAFQNDLTFIKCSAEADFDMRYLEAVAVIESVRWGA